MHNCKYPFVSYTKIYFPPCNSHYVSHASWKYNSVNLQCHSLVLISIHDHLLESNLYKTIRKSVDYGPKIIVWDLTYIMPVVCNMSYHLYWEVCYVCSLSISYRVAPVHVWISADTVIFILVSPCIYETSDIRCKHRLVYSCDSNCTCFPLVVACLCNNLIDGAFHVIALLHLTPCLTGELLPLIIGE